MVFVQPSVQAVTFWLFNAFNLHIFDNLFIYNYQKLRVNFGAAGKYYLNVESYKLTKINTKMHKNI